MDNRTAPLAQGEDLLLNQLEVVTDTTVAGTLYGITLTLFCLYVHALVPRIRNDDRKRQAIFMLAYSTIIMLCGLYDLVSNAWVDQNAYIEHSSYPGGPYTYIMSSYHSNATQVVGLACQVVIDTLTSAIQIWRVWVIWNATRYAYWVTLLPFFCFLAFTGLNLRTSILEATLSPAELGQLEYKIDQAETNALQGATTIFCTILISLYLIHKQSQQRKLIGKSQGSAGYGNVVAMIIESYALESVWLLTTAVLWGHDAIAFFAESVTYIEIIAYLLVQYRVARGKAYESQREQPRNISSLRWNHSNYTTTQFWETDGVQDGPPMPILPVASDVHWNSSMV